MESPLVSRHGRHPGGLFVCSSRCDMELSQKTVNQSAAHEHIWSCTMVIQQPSWQTWREWNRFGFQEARNREILCHPRYVTRYESLRWKVTLGLGERRALESNWKITTKSCTSNFRFAADVLLMANSETAQKRWWRTPKEVPRRRIQNPFGEDDSSFQPVKSFRPHRSTRWTFTSVYLDCHMQLWNKLKILVFVSSSRRSRTIFIDRIFKPIYNKIMPATHLVKSPRRWLRTWAM